ncbi:MAG: hypothetical protein L0Y66_25135 [Myxococcaceae bacterium]|nr:hypothetical protein [Myxococcaceae bacterium]MCI0669438.1 hypothetical protein [Myxococcaceae bacterium]
MTVASLVLLLACAEVPQGPVRVQALVLSADGAYTPTTVELRTVRDATALEGSVFRFLGGARLVVDGNDPELQQAITEEDMARAVLKGKGQPVTANYIVAEDGVLWPADFHTWNLVTAAFGLERASEYFHTVAQVPPGELGTATVYYFPEFLLPGSVEGPVRDNAIFYTLVQGFLLLPFDRLQSAPMAINTGLLAHEYSHLVFNRRVYGGRRLPEAFTEWSAGTVTPGLNVLKSLDEGLADFHAFGATCLSPGGCNSRFLEASLGESARVRDMAQSHCLTAELRTGLLNSAYTQFGPSSGDYQVGTVLASALHRAAAGDAARQQALGRAVVAAYSDESPETPGLVQLVEASLDAQAGFTLTDAVRALLVHVEDAALRADACHALVDQLQLNVDALAGVCAPDVGAPTLCPALDG